MSVLTWWRRDPPGPEIVPLDTASAGRLAAIHGACFARGWSSPDFERLLADRAIIADGLQVDGRTEVDGFVLSRRVLDEAEILTVAIAAPARGRGFAALLLSRHLDVLQRAGVRRVHLEVEDGNEPALALYRRQGFVQTGRRAAYYTKPGERPAAAILMSRDL